MLVPLFDSNRPPCTKDCIASPEVLQTDRQTVHLAAYVVRKLDNVPPLLNAVT